MMSVRVDVDAREAQHLSELGRPVFVLGCVQEPLVALDYTAPASLIFLLSYHPTCLPSHIGVSLILCGPRSSPVTEDRQTLNNTRHGTVLGDSVHPLI
jgi:hypothetical protein